LEEKMSDSFQKMIDLEDSRRMANLLENGSDLIYNHPKLQLGIILMLKGCIDGKVTEGKALSAISNLKRNKVSFENLPYLESYSEIKDKIPKSIRNYLTWR